MQALTPNAHWHLFCRVIDNFGDIGVAWRLAVQLAERQQTVTLWVDDASALAWMAPDGHTGVTVQAWPERIDEAAWPQQASVIVELFGCDLPECVQHRIAQHPAPLTWINLEYLSAEPYVARSHGLRSPVMSGPASGRDKWFFYPGFTADTGGLLRESDLIAQREAFDRAEWRHRHCPIAAANALWASLFCYEPPALAQLLDTWAAPQPLLITPGRAQAAVSQHQASAHWPTHWQALASTDQRGFDHMLWACDVNFVRGEDSLVRALWAGEALIWQIYPQDDDAHHDKLLAFLDWVDGPADWRLAHLGWNGLTREPLPTLDATRLATWRETMQDARRGLLTQADLCSQLLDFVASRP